MSEEKKQPETDANGNDVLLKKIEVLEKALNSIEDSRKKRNMVSLIGLILLLLALVLFFINLKNFASEKLNDAKFQNELITTLRNDLKDMLNENPNITLMQQDFKEKVLPYVSKQILERFKEDVPKFQEAGENFADELKVYLNNDVKDKLIKALTESLVEVESVLKEKYPTMKVEELHKIINEARHIFIIRITRIIEKKLDYISKDLASLKTSIENFKNCKEYQKHDPLNPHTIHNVKIEMVESMLELIIYQLNDEKAQRPVESLTAGGVK
jgi:predicted hydrocarbon binding protein